MNTYCLKFNSSTRGLSCSCCNRHTNDLIKNPFYSFLKTKILCRQNFKNEKYFLKISYSFWTSRYTFTKTLVKRPPILKYLHLQSKLTILLRLRKYGICRPTYILFMMVQKLRKSARARGENVKDTRVKCLKRSKCKYFVYCNLNRFKSVFNLGEIRLHFERTYTYLLIIIKQWVRPAC